MKYLILSLLLCAFLALFLKHDPEPDTVHVVASRATTEVTAWPQMSIPDLGPRFGELVVAMKPKPKARTAPRQGYRAAAVGSVPDLIRRVFARFGPAVAEQAVRVAGCESRYDPAVVNSSGHTGLFQLSPRYHTARAQRLGFSWAQMREAEPNALVAADLYAEQGWGPWTCRWAA